MLGGHYVRGRPAAAMADGGQYAVAWTEVGNTFSVFVQRHDADGSPVGGPVQVSPAVQYVTRSPAIAMGGDGRIVVAWTASDNDHHGAFFQMYDGAGAAKVGPSQLADSSVWVGWSPAVAMDAKGDFVVAYTLQGDVGTNIRFQRHDANGTPLGEATALGPAQEQYVPLQPAIAMDAKGRFVIAWTALGDVYAVFAQRYDANGNTLGDTLAVSPPGQVVGLPPAVSMASDGRFVVAWNDFGDSKAVLARTFDAEGAPASDVIQVNDSGLTYAYTDDLDDDQEPPPQSVAMVDDGDFVVAWTDMDKKAPTFRRFDAAGNPLTTDQKVSPKGSFSLRPSWTAASRCAGSHLVVWDDDDDTSVKDTVFLGN